MAQYLLNVIQPDGAAPPPEVLGPIMREVAAVTTQMQEAGVFVFTAGLHPASAATVLTPKGDDVLVTDGPFAEAKEHIGGFTLIDVPDLDAALDWGRRVARATSLPIEVRPVAGAG